MNESQMTGGAMGAQGGRVAVLVVNLGTPDAPTPAAVKRYLREFLSDPRVVEIPQAVWQPILRGVVLNVRPRKSAHAYQQVWTDDGSPLAMHTRDTARGLRVIWGDAITVDWAMRYGAPSIADRLTALKESGHERILIAPLYPQYCGATTASVMDAVGQALEAMRWQPAIRTLPPYFDDPAYIEALRARMQSQLAALPFAPDRLLVSFHGMPKRTRELGDPYYAQCVQTARLLGEALGREIIVTFQSRFGPAKWLEPATDTVLEGLPGQGVRSVAVMTPGFSADCLETLEEIALRGKESFVAAGGEHFAFLPCLNAQADAIAMYRQLLGRELAGWVEPSSI
ncbi:MULTISPECIES: ferrochelatase [Sphingobium]|uniref:ferrochelatase n=1 Tax=Sphingobium TaxID=165695 RepID=UPI00185E12CF|nr:MULTISPECIES: ferrochelatase [Sphingobium]MCW2363420.1 ferrochelatase [Sphingobium sp. B10D3B]MCW2403181.1 ferrochelatase [Sphingobium sp. B10D7B]MCW2410160.1 ferrochelatase [Sphingobium xanthum]